MNNDILMIEFETTPEYKKWIETLLAIIGYLKDKKIDDSELLDELMTDHFNASLELGKVMDKLKDRDLKRIDENFEEFIEESNELV